jgi:hypothetical protein
LTNPNAPKRCRSRPGGDFAFNFAFNSPLPLPIVNPRAAPDSGFIEFLEE